MSERLLLVDPDAQALGEAQVPDLPRLLKAGDVLVLNDAATFPGSVFVQTAWEESLEVRFLEAPYESLTRAVLLGAGDHRTPTEHRAAPPRLHVGDVLEAGDHQWIVAELSPLSPRLVRLAWPGPVAQRFRTLYALGRPIQYAHVPEPLALYDVQTPFAARPFAAEMPSATRPLRHGLVRALAQQGVEVLSLTHAAGISASGDARIDAALPLPERYEIPRGTAQRVNAAHEEGRRVIAAGTSVVRALEDSAQKHGQVRAGMSEASLVLEPHSVRRVVDGLFTGIHVPGESHHRLLGAFASEALLREAASFSASHGYRRHEFGDACLVLPGVLAAGQWNPRAA